MSTNEAPIYGLLLAGGKSRRMGRDKALLSYHGKPQIVWAFELLDNVCKKSFVSVAPDQVNESTRAELPQLVDTRPDMGPSGGLLTAEEHCPGVAWLVVACDLPFVEQKTLDSLVVARNPTFDATAFISSHDGLPEPLCAIWEPSGLEKLRIQAQQNNYCPRKCLIMSNTYLIEQNNPQWLDNINSESDLVSKELTG